jgi:hypothetical protein
MTFLRPSKFYAQSAFEKMQRYFKFKLKHKKYCDNLSVESSRIVFEDNIVKFLPLRDVDGRRILYLDCGSKLIERLKSYKLIHLSHYLETWNPSRCSTYDIFRAIQLSLNAAMAEPLTQVKNPTSFNDEFYYFTIIDNIAFFKKLF